MGKCLYSGREEDTCRHSYPVILLLQGAEIKQQQPYPKDFHHPRVKWHVPIHLDFLGLIRSLSIQDLTQAQPLLENKDMDFP